MKCGCKIWIAQMTGDPQIEMCDGHTRFMSAVYTELEDTRQKLTEVEKQRDMAVQGRKDFRDSYRKEREKVREVESSEVLLHDALDRMIDTHGSHGPCVDNNCSDCKYARKKATEAMA